MKFFHRYETNGGLVLQDQECVIAAGRYILFYYPKPKEFLQIDEKIKTYPGAVKMTMNEYLGRMGFLRGLWLIIKNFIGVNHCYTPPYEPSKEEKADNFEEFFETMECPDADLRPPIIIGGTYNNEV